MRERLTARSPAGGVSGWYFSNAQSRHFGLGRLHRDHIEDYARRKGLDLAEVERWLASSLAYDPALGEG